MRPELAEQIADLEWEQAQSVAGELLGLPAALPASALRRAIVEDRYCFTLLAYRGNLARLHQLITDERTRLFELPSDAKPDSARTEQSSHSTAHLLKQGTHALIRWGRDGFSTVDKDTRSRRWSACLACPELTDRPTKWIYKVTVISSIEDRVCAACGCIASRKVRLPSERCPRPSPDQPGRSRWGDALSSIS